MFTFQKAACVGCLIFALSVIVKPVQALTPIEELGQALFFDTNLSKNRTQSCATCHDPDHGFADPRDNGVKGMASLGDDGKSLGDRNAPTASYAKFSPPFAKYRRGFYAGGQFHDGRANSLSDQAGGPPLNPIEMGMASKAEVIKRLLENDFYVDQFKTNFGTDIFEDTDKAYDAMSKAIEAFEKTEQFSPFDSKYDRFIRGEVKLTDEEELGRILFFSHQFTNCHICHQLRQRPGSEKETFTNYEYHNIGTPENIELRKVNGVGVGSKDTGVFNNPKVLSTTEAGRFKVPTLRNIAVTGPYMHNGIFADLKTVVLFYNKYNSRSDAALINPETGKEWDLPEIPENISFGILRRGDALDEKRVNALVAFMKTLTDKRYEHLLK